MHPYCGSDIADDNSTVKISLKYTVKNPFNILGKRQITIYEKRISSTPYYRLLYNVS